MITTEILRSTNRLIKIQSHCSQWSIIHKVGQWHCKRMSTVSCSFVSSIYTNIFHTFCIFPTSLTTQFHPQTRFFGSATPCWIIRRSLSRSSCNSESRSRMDFLSLVAFQVRIGAHPGHSKTDWNVSSFRTGLWSKTIVTHCSHRFIKRDAFFSNCQVLPRHLYIHLFSPCPWLVSLQLYNFSFSLIIELYTISRGN